MGRPSQEYELVIMKTRINLFVWMVTCILIVSPLGHAHAAEKCFQQTNQCMSGRIARFWNENGGLAVFGYPIGPLELTTVDGKTFSVQRFERNRLELHPENVSPYDVLLGRLGADRLGQQGRDWFGFAKSGDTGGCRVFAETGHAVCGPILKAWRGNGLQIDGKKAVSYAESLALFGMPLSGLMTETLSDGKQYQVQWFERARFELHPENAAPYDVLLGLLGNEVASSEVKQHIAATPAAIEPLPNTEQKLVPLPYKHFPLERFSDFKHTLNYSYTTWYVDDDYFDRLNDGTAIKETATGYLTNAIQWFIETNDFHTPMGSYGSHTYMIYEYSDRQSAEKMFNVFDMKELFTTISTNEEIMPNSSCIERKIIGHYTDMRMAKVRMICGNRVLDYSYYAGGTDYEFNMAFPNIIKYFEQALPLP